MVMLFYIILFSFAESSLCKVPSQDSCEASEVFLTPPLSERHQYKPIEKRRKKCSVREKIGRLLKQLKRERSEQGNLQETHHSAVRYQDNRMHHSTDMMGDESSRKATVVAGMPRGSQKVGKVEGEIFLSVPNKGGVDSKSATRERPPVMDEREIDREIFHASRDSRSQNNASRWAMMKYRKKIMNRRRGRRGTLRVPRAL